MNLKRKNIECKFILSIRDPVERKLERSEKSI